MFRLIRIRLALSYAGIALLVTLSLGAVLLVRLRAYYAGMELDYLNSNAKAISGLAAPLLVKQSPREVQDAQVSNLAFLSQTRVRILDPQRNVLADSGPWQSTKVGLGVVRAQKIKLAGGEGENPPSTSVIVIQSRPMEAGSAAIGAVKGTAEAPGAVLGFHTEPPPLAGDAKTAPAGSAGGAAAASNGPDILFFNAPIEVSNSVYGFDLNGAPGEPGARSSQVVLRRITDGSGVTLGFVELSESPAYGKAIVNSVASGLAVAGGLAILLAIAAGWLASRRLTAPLLNLTQATQQMSGGDLSVRVAEAGRKDEFGLLGRSFNQMAGRIEETVLTLRRFLSDAAHELQTPLTALRTNLELAHSEQNSPATEKYLRQAQEQIERLQRLIRDLLSLSRLESANGEETFQRVDLCDLARQVSEPFAARAEQAGQSFELDLPAGEALVRGSAEKLQSALGSLIDNALKFTPTGGAIVIHLAVEPDACCLTVSDTGIGIPPDEIDMLFNRFHRARNASAYTGSGLGLAIVRTIAQAHGGSVEAANNAHGGASFTLRLPREIRE